MKRRVLAVVGIAILSVALAAAYVIRARRVAVETEHRDSGASSDVVTMRELLQQPHTLFRTTRLGEGYGHLVVTAPALTEKRYLTTLECDRVAAVATVGVCLTADRGVLTTYRAVVFDEGFGVRHRIDLAGIPSRVRLSPDGRVAGITVFVSGHAYTDMSFSTQTILIDTRTGHVLADLETFAVTRDGKPFSNANFNYWGVTFTADSNTFYVTLGSGKQTFLVRADVAARRAEVIRESIECPALSPDNRHIAFKKRLQDGVQWRLAVLELASGTEHLIEGEKRSVDDQVEWLDNRRIAYSVIDDAPGRGGSSLWAVDVFGGPASLWADGAYSPAIIAVP